MTSVLERVVLVPDGIVLDQRCVRCGKRCAGSTTAAPGFIRIRARGLCRPCYQFCAYWGLIWDYPRKTRSRDDLLDDYVILRDQGYTWRQIAKRMGMPYPGFERALWRARKLNDPRAARLNEKGYPR